MHFVRWLQNFANNDDRIAEHNMKKLSYTLGHNQYSHMTYEQWRAAVHFGLDRKDDNRLGHVLIVNYSSTSCFSRVYLPNTTF